MVNDDSLVSLIVIEAVNRRRIHAERMAGRARRAGSRTAGGQWSERRHAKPSIESTAKSAREFVHRHTPYTASSDQQRRKRPKATGQRREATAASNLPSVVDDVNRWKSGGEEAIFKSVRSVRCWSDPRTVGHTHTHYAQRARQGDEPISNGQNSLGSSFLVRSQSVNEFEIEPNSG